MLRSYPNKFTFGRSSPLSPFNPHSRLIRCRDAESLPIADSFSVREGCCFTKSVLAVGRLGSCFDR